VIDLVEHRVSLAFRFGVLSDSSMKARRVAPNFRVLCAAPSYLKRHGTPSRLDDLSRHSCIVFSESLEDHWVFRHEGKTTSVRVKGRLSVNDGEVAQALAVAGAGLIYKSVWEIGTHLQAGRLVPVMGDHMAPSKPLQLVFPAGALPVRVRRFIDLTLARLPIIGPRLAWESEAAREAAQRGARTGA
jgi:DNA-binding transcriptional LysR family regulator